MLESAWLTNWALASPADGLEDRSTGLVAFGVFLIALLVIVGVVVKVVNLKRKRTGEAVHLQAAISEALFRETALFSLAITPIAHVPFWRGSPATIAVRGTVPTPEHRETVVRVVRSEASRIRSDFDIDDRLAISSTTRAAS